MFSWTNATTVSVGLATEIHKLNEALSKMLLMELERL